MDGVYFISKGLKNDVTMLTRYDTSGRINNQLSDDETCCLTCVISGQTYYKIKAANGGELYNPLKEEGNPNYNLTMMDKRGVMRIFDWKSTNVDAFNYYVQFLKTGIESYYKVAARNV